MSANGLIEKELTEVVIGCFYKVYNYFGFGFLEKVYENALAIELRKHGLTVVQQAPVDVFYEGELVGDYFADLIVNDCIIIELKSAEELIARHDTQLLNYLKATGKPVGLLLNFGPGPEIKRRVKTKSAKPRSAAPRSQNPR